MKICLLTPFHSSWTRQEFSILRELGHDVCLSYIKRKGRGGRVRFVGGLLENIKLFFESFPVCSKSDLIYCWFVFPTGVLATFMGKFLRKSVLLNAIGADVAYVPVINYGVPTRSFCRPFVSWALKNATKVIAISKESARWAEFWGAKDVRVIYEGIDTEKFKPLNSGGLQERGEFMLLAVSPLEEIEIVRKDFESLLRALREIVDAGLNVKLVIVGRKGAGHSLLQKIVKDLGIGKNIVFTGFIPESELLALYRRCDVFVLPSLHEGFPTVCAEAQACEKPVISVNASSIPEVIKDAETGLLVSPKNPVELANAITKLLCDSRLRQQLGKSGRKRVIHLFSKEIRKQKLQEIMAASTFRS